MVNWPYNRQLKRNAFVTVSTDFGTMIVNRFDYNVTPDGGVYGVGHNLLETSSFDPHEINLILNLLSLLKQTRGDGVVFLDGGANIGVHSVAVGRLMQGWGSVISFEAQERIFYALAGNVTVNNLFNVRVRWNALSDLSEVISIPAPNYLMPSSFGSLEMEYNASSEFIGQPIESTQEVQAITIDSLNLPRLDFLKLDVEKMEEKVLRGAAATIDRCQPIMHIEQLKCDKAILRSMVESFGYHVYDLGSNMLCVPVNDAVRNHIN